MINELLYKALQAQFGSVLVENEGVTADIVVTERNGIPSWHLPKGDELGEHGEQYRINCPFCRGSDGSRDHKHHMYISYMTFAHPDIGGTVLHAGPLYAHCFRCQAMKDPDKRRELDFMIRAGEACVQGSGVVCVNTAGTSVEPQERLQYQTSDSVTLDGVRTWIEGYSPCDDNMDTDIFEYLDGRGVTWDMIEQFAIGWGPVKTPRTGRLLKNGVPWVIFPVVMNSRLVGVQARCPDKFITDSDDLRYWTHPAMRKSAVVYNLDRARSLGVGVLCEGVFDVIKVGAPGVCVFGKQPSAAQLGLLATIGRGLVILPDTDKHKEFDTVSDAYELAANWNSQGVFDLGVQVVELSAKDAGEMSRNDVWAEMIAKIPDGKLRDYLATDILTRI